jgi:phosphate transport system permease protein
MIRVWSIFSSIFVLLIISALILFVTLNALPAMSLPLFFGDTPALKALAGAPVWGGLWTPLKGTIKLLLLCGVMAIPLGLSAGIFTSEYASARLKRTILPFMEAMAGIPSIIIGLFGFVMILFLRRHFFPANTGMLTAAFCLTVLVLPTLTLNTYSALNAVPQTLKITATALGISQGTAIFRLYIPAVKEKILSGLLISAGRCAEDAAVILMTGAVASSITGGILGKFEALPFFIYHTSANYTNETELAQVFAAALILLILTLGLLAMASFVKRVKL